MIVKTANPLQSEPVIVHDKLHTTFTGLVHPISDERAAVHQYLGIKYASVPARFRQSRLFTTFPPTTDATHHGPICPQAKMSTKGYEEELFDLTEDVVPRQALKQNEFECLNLNITCPSDVLPGTRLPVMFFIHGGGSRGSGSSWLYDGGAFVQKSIMTGKPVVLVTINYRLGMLGFAASPALREDNHHAGDEGVGNYGLRDQRKALEWVYSFISGFGGDPENITLFGSASGAADILCHLHSSANEKLPLFKRAIVQSALMDGDIPNVHSAGWQFSKLMSALQAHTVDELRAVPVEKLAACTPHIRAVDDGVFFAHGWRDALCPEPPEEPYHFKRHEIVPELEAIAQKLGTRHRGLPSRSRSRSRTRTPQHPHRHENPANQQPLMIGDCAAESLLWSLPASLWSGPGVVRRIRAICQSLSKSSALLRAYDISSHTPIDELPDRVLELINDARFAWPTEIVASHAKEARGGRNVWRYVFDQEGPSKGVPHHAVDLLYLFDNVPLTVPASISPPSVFSPGMSPMQTPHLSRPDTPEMSFGSDTDSDVDFGFGFNAAGEDDAWGVPVVDEWTYTRVRDTVQGRWLAFAHGEAPWSSEEKVYVFGPEGEVGERSMSIFAGRRRESAWKEALEPLGMQLMQKVGIELSNGPSAGMR
ncbi:carboxylesterase [Trametopsis cervina]|nr:carboxylesterase [Trametopsis cervina]